MPNFRYNKVAHLCFFIDKVLHNVLEDLSTESITTDADPYLRQV